MAAISTMGVSVFFRKGNIVFEPFWHRNKDIMEDSENLITSGNIVRDDTDREEIIEILRMSVGIFFSRKFAIYTKWRLNAV